MPEGSYWQGMANRRWPRRAFLKGAAVLAAGTAGAVAVGCGGGEKDGQGRQATRPAAEETPRPGGRLQFAIDANFISIDPHLTVG
jgi:hypothetical protein